MTLTAGLRAAAYGVPFQPCGGIEGSDLAALNGWARLSDPYGGAPVHVIPAIAPDVAVIHASEATAQGDARSFGTTHWDRVMTRAAKRVLVVAERLASVEAFAARPELTLVPHFMVDAVAIVPGGAWPGSAHPEYGVDYAAVQAYLDGSLEAHLVAAPEARLVAAPEALLVAAPEARDG